ncbi:MAG: hypothetical protein ACOC5J_01915 [Gemmatimonadota bacterium]
MDIVAADTSGKTKDSDHWFDRGVDRFATGTRIASVLPGATLVRYQSVNTFAGKVLKAAHPEPIRVMCILDHGYVNVGNSYESSVTGETHNWALIEFGSQVVGHHNFAEHEEAFGILAPVLNRSSHVVFLNCLVGRDPALLYKFAALWDCRVTGCTDTQTGLELVNIWKGEWVTVDPDKRYRRTTSHPLYG